MTVFKKRQVSWLGFIALDILPRLHGPVAFVDALPDSGGTAPDFHRFPY